MKNPRWDKKEEDDAAEKGTNEGVRVFYPGQTCFIYKAHTNGPLERQGPKYTSGFLKCR
jgi:hypothetical protein